jgi:cytochrome c-type biogenesis protein CcmE
MVIVGMAMLGVGIAVGFTLRALNENLNMFYSPTQLAAGNVPAGKKIRLGGLVTKGSVHRQAGQLELTFDVTDTKETTTVHYAGVLPDLFREGQGIIAYGVLGADGSFRADEVLAKHDENYMPPEVADALKAQGHPGTPDKSGG